MTAATKSPPWRRIVEPLLTLPWDHYWPSLELYAAGKGGPSLETAKSFQAATDGRPFYYSGGSAEDEWAALVATYSPKDAAG